MKTKGHANIGASHLELERIVGILVGWRLLGRRRFLGRRRKLGRRGKLRQLVTITSMGRARRSQRFPS